MLSRYYGSIYNSVCLIISESCSRVVLLPITRQQILDSSKLKDFADDNFKFDEGGRKYKKKG